jgi:hypothetical protein
LIYGQMSLMTGHRSGGNAVSSTTRSLDKYYYNEIGVIVWP